MPGMLGQFNDGVQCHWTNYFTVKDCVASACSVRGAGGEGLSGPTDLPGVGPYSVIRDPAGTVFAIITLLGS